MTEPEVEQSESATGDTIAPTPQIVATPTTASSKRGMAATIIGAHTISHIYVHGFYVIVPIVYKELGLVPIQAGIIDAARWLSSGLSGIFVGFLVDLYRHRRGFFLGLSLLMLAGGYLLVSLAPSYGLILMSLIFAHIGSAMWHPPGIGLLSEHFSKRRGLFIALHRSTGSIGDTVGPVLVGFLLVAITWRQTLQFGFPLAALAAAVLWLVLWNAGGRKPDTTSSQVDVGKQWALLKRITKGSSLIALLIVSALRGMGDRAILLFLPLYLSNVLCFNTVQVGLYLGMLNVLAIVSGPMVGAISDRIGRKPIIVIALFVSAIFPPLMVLTGATIGLTIVVLLFGLFLYSVNSLVQAAAMDVAEGMKLEGTLVGMLWGNNAFFGAISPIIAGALVGVFGFHAAFYYAAATYLIGGMLALRLSLPRV